MSLSPHLAAIEAAAKKAQSVITLCTVLFNLTVTALVIFEVPVIWAFLIVSAFYVVTIFGFFHVVRGIQREISAAEMDDIELGRTDGALSDGAKTA